jgi:phosphate:Na+ symporter
MAIDMWGVALVHTIFKILSVIIMAPFYRQLEKLATVSIKDKGDENEVVNLLDERLLNTPGVAVARAAEVTENMAVLACDALEKSLTLFDGYDPKVADMIRDLEEKGDMYEDALGSYLVKASSSEMNEADSKLVTKLLHVIGDFERISDHAVNILESVEEMREKKIDFSARANSELAVLRRAVGDIVGKARDSYVNNDIKLATEVEPLEQVVDDIRDTIKFNHTLRLQKSECSIEHGFILGDLLTNFERVADHCSNIAGSVIEISAYDALDVHKYIATVKREDENFDQKYNEYKRMYSFDAQA